jgi:hypothetical protein
MRVVDSEPQAWFLLEHEGDLYVDGNYDYSFVGYEFLLKLNRDERACFESEGRAFVDGLTRKIQDSAPNARGSASPYAGRNLANILGEQVLDAVQTWRDSRGE